MLFCDDFVKKIKSHSIDLLYDLRMPEITFFSNVYPRDGKKIHTCI